MSKNDIEKLEEDLEVEDIDGEQTSSSSKDLKPVNQKVVSDGFTDCIKKYLDDFAAKDSLFGVKYKNPDKNIENCCKYIIGVVKSLNVNGMSDEEVFHLAREYYEEDDVIIESTINYKVVINHKELQENKKKPVKSPKVIEGQQSIFDFIGEEK